MPHTGPVLPEDPAYLSMEEEGGYRKMLLSSSGQIFRRGRSGRDGIDDILHGDVQVCRPWKGCTTERGACPIVVARRKLRSRLSVEPEIDVTCHKQLREIPDRDTFYSQPLAEKNFYRPIPRACPTTCLHVQPTIFHYQSLRGCHRI